MEWLQSLQGWLKTTAPFAPSALIAAVLAALAPKRDASIMASIIGALLAAPVIGLTFIEWFPAYKLTAHAVAIIGGVSIYWIVGQVPTLWHAVLKRFGFKEGEK